MIVKQSRAPSTRTTRKQKKSNQSARRLRFDAPQGEWLEPRLLLAADLSVSKAQIAPVSGGVTAGEMISYQITVANGSLATSAATNTTLTDTLPAGETLINASTANGGALSVNGNTLTENLGTINANTTVTVTVDALVNGQVGGTLTNTASVSSPDENGGLPIVSVPVSTTINAQTSTTPSLSITKTAANNNAAISAGGSETYTITVTNNSANDATGVTVLDSLPKGATFSSGTVTGGTGATTLSAPTGNLETIDLGTLAAHTSATISLTITGSATAGVMVNTATVASASGNAAAANATASVATAVQGTTVPATGSVDLSVTKSASANATIGANQTYTITVSNQGTADATGVVVTDLLPSGATFISGSTSVSGVNVTSANGMASATLPTLAAGGSATLTLTLTPSVSGALTDTAFVEANQTDTNQANNTATATSLVAGTATPAADLSVTKTASATTGSVGANEVYTITVTNNSANAATGVVVSDVLPTGATFVSATSSAGASLSPTLGAIVDRIGSMAANSSQTLTVTVTPSAAGTITDTAYVAGDQVDPNLANNIATLTTPVQGTTAASVDLSISKTAANNNANVVLGSNETYTITVTNHGNDAATGVVVSDVLPAAATFVGGTTSVNGVSVSDLNGTATANLGTLGAGATATLTVTLTPTAAGSITDTAYVESNDVDANQANNVSSVTSQVVSAAGQANLSIAKIASPSPDTVGQNLSYVLVITNTGAAAADNVSVSDVLPSGATFVSGSTDVNGVNVTNNNGTVSANLGTVAAGAVETVTIVVTPTQAGSLSNTANITTTTPNISTHTSASVTTTINPSANNQANLSIFKAATPNPGTVGQNETYVLVVINTGTAAADNVVVNDSLANTVTFVSGSTDVNGVNVTNNNGTVTANLGTVAAGAVETVTLIVTPNQAGTLSNTATVSTSTSNASTHTTATTQTTINPSSNNQANVSITKTASPSPGTVGQNLTYTIVVTNAAGAASAAGVTVTDTLPTAIASQVTAQDTTRNVALTVNNGVITDNIGTLAAGTADVITVTVVPTQAGTLTNTATVATTTPNAGSNTTATVQTTINSSNNNQANLSITKSASPSPGTVGQNLTYTIVVTNAAGAASAAGVTVTDTLPTAIGSQVTAQDTTRNVALTVNNGSITDNIGTLAGGSSDTITVSVTPTQAGTLTNTATVSTTTSNASTNTTATVQTTINSSNNNQANVSITKTASPSPGAVGQALTYTIVVTDAAGAANAAGVTVTDTLPTAIGAQVTAQDTTRNVALTVNNGVITDNIGTLNAGSSDTITVSVTPTQAGTLANTASVTTTTSNSSNQTSATVNTTIGSTLEHSCYLNGQPGDNSDQTFLTNLYRELFGRNPDSTGFQFWLNFLATNGGTTASGQSNVATRNQVVQIFLNSQEYFTHWVDCVFDEFMQRKVDEGGERFFVKQLASGVSEQTVLVEILTSQEFFGHGSHGNHGDPHDNDNGAPGSTNLAFVDNLYGQLLGRGADTGSEQAWVNALNSGQLTRAQVVEAILNSPEEAKDLLDAVGATSGAPGTPATGSYPLAVITGGGWDNLYFQGKLATLNASAVNQFMSELEAGTAWQTVQLQMLELPQFYNA